MIGAEAHCKTKERVKGVGMSTDSLQKKMKVTEMAGATMMWKVKGVIFFKIRGRLELFSKLTGRRRT